MARHALIATAGAVMLMLGSILQYEAIKQRSQLNGVMSPYTLMVLGRGPDLGNFVDLGTESLTFTDAEIEDANLWLDSVIEGR